MNVLVGIFDHVVLVVLHLGIVGLDIVIFFLLVKFVADRWPHAVFRNFDRIGASLIEPLFALTQRVAKVTYNGCFFVLSVALSVCRLVLVAIANSIILTAS